MLLANSDNILKELEAMKFQEVLEQVYTKDINELVVNVQILEN